MTGAPRMMGDDYGLAGPEFGRLAREPVEVIAVNLDGIPGRDEIPIKPTDSTVIRHDYRRADHGRLWIAGQCKVGPERAAQQAAGAEGQHPLLGKVCPGGFGKLVERPIIERGAVSARARPAARSGTAPRASSAAERWQGRRR